MIQVNVKEFSIRTTKYLNSKEDVVVTKYGKPMAIVNKIEKDSIQEVLLELKRLMKEAKISKAELLRTLDEVRKDIYA
jgi:hypothetical protein